MACAVHTIQLLRLGCITCLHTHILYHPRKDPGGASVVRKCLGVQSHCSSGLSWSQLAWLGVVSARPSLADGSAAPPSSHMDVLNTYYTICAILCISLHALHHVPMYCWTCCINAPSVSGATQEWHLACCYITALCGGIV